MGILYGCYQGERASRLSTFSNLKVWNQTQLILVFKAQDMEAFNTV